VVVCLRPTKVSRTVPNSNETSTNISNPESTIAFLSFSFSFLAHFVGMKLWNNIIGYCHSDMTLMILGIQQNLPQSIWLTEVMADDIN